MLQHLKRMERENEILSSLNRLGIATRKQLQVMNNLGGERNANRILANMEKDGTVKSIRMDQKIYYNPEKGKKENKGQMLHKLMRNDLYIHLGTPSDWRIEQSVEFEMSGEVITLVPDATFRRNAEFHFVEIDNKQSMKTNKDKIDKYHYLSKLIFQQYNHTPTVIWYTAINRRKEDLQGYCEKKGVKNILYGLGEI